MAGATAWHSTKFAFLGVGLGILLLGCWTGIALPTQLPVCSGPFACTYVYGPNYALSGMLLVVGGLLTMGCGLVFAFQALLTRLVGAATRVNAVRP
jgi:hypothetical protein